MDLIRCSSCRGSVSVSYIGTRHFLLTPPLQKPAAMRPSLPHAPLVLLLSPRDISSGRMRTYGRVYRRERVKVAELFAGESMETSKRWIILQKWVRARALASRHERGFHLSRHFHHTVDPIRANIPVEDESRMSRWRWSWGGGEVKASLGLNRALDHIRERILNIIHGNRGKKESDCGKYREREIHVHYSLSTPPDWNCFAHTTHVRFHRRGAQT